MSVEVLTAVHAAVTTLPHIVSAAALTADPTSSVDLLSGLENVLVAFPILGFIIGARAIVSTAIGMLRGAKSVAR